MNILIVYPKLSRYLGGHYDVQLGLAYISSTLKAKGHQITCVNLNHYSDVSVIKEAVERGNIEVVCTGGQSPLYKQIKSIFDEVREYYPQIITILGDEDISFSTRQERTDNPRINNSELCCPPFRLQKR